MQTHPDHASTARPTPDCSNRGRGLLALALLVGTTVGLANAQAAQSTFGHARARRLADLGKLPTAHDVVARDIINYHRHRVPLPTAAAAVALELRFDVASATAGDEVWLQVGYATRSEGDRSLAPPCAVALVVDCSGSMREHGKLEQVRRGLQALVGQLRPDDQIALVRFSEQAEVVTALRPRGDGRWIAAAVDALHPDGRTNLHGGILRGLMQLRSDDGGPRTRRLVVLTDGIANVGLTDPAIIAADVMERSGSDIDVSTIGVGTQLDHALLQRLAEANRGLCHFVADPSDVQKVFVREAESLLVPAARQVAIELHLPPTLADAEVVGEHAERGDDGRLRVMLPDLNAGATGVILVRSRVCSDGPDDATVRAALCCEPAGQQQPIRVPAKARLRVARFVDRTSHRDHEVRRNAAIAVLATGLHRMAEACEQSRWGDADRFLATARARADRLFPGDDNDVARVREIVAGHARTLRRYVDRFRDF